MSEVSENAQETVNFKRFLSYIYAYEDDRKLRNVGFVKAEIRYGKIRMQVVVSGLNSKGGKPLELCLLDDALKRTVIGQVHLQNGRGEFRSASGLENMWNSGLAYSEICGVSLQGVGDRRHYYMTLWRERKKEEVRSGLLEKKEPHIESDRNALLKMGAGSLESGRGKITVGSSESGREETTAGSSESGRGKIIAGNLKTGRGEESEKEKLIKAEDNKIAGDSANIETYTKEELAKTEDNKVAGDPGDIEIHTEEEQAEKKPMEEEKIKGEQTKEKQAEEKPMEEDQMTSDQEEDLNAELEAASELIRQSDQMVLHASEITASQYSADARKAVDKRMTLWKKFCSRYPHVDIRPVSLKTESGEEHFSDNRRICEVLRIRPNDIGRLPRNNWVLAHNSFLQHAYNHNRHLILYRMECRQEGQGWINRWFLGIPGSCDAQEAVVAEVFGLKNYMTCKNGGFWYTEVHMGEYS